MEDLQLCTLYSGSKGNCTYIRAGGDAILIDAGRSLRALTQALDAAGGSMETVRAVFVTHEHADHTSALEMPQQIGRKNSSLSIQHVLY